jgi:RNA polymerase sigma-70 factor (ECF subfamily)
MVQTGEDVLIRRAQRGDREAFCQLARGYQRRVYSLALHYCRDRHDAEDLSQEVWLKAYRSLASFRRESSFYTWLRQITVNTFLNHRRGQSFTRDGESRPLRMEGLEAADAHEGLGHLSGAGVQEGFEQQVLVGRVMNALSELTPQQRLIFLLKHREGMTYQEIAATFGCSAGSVKKTLFRVVLKLRESLGVTSERAECVAVTERP